MSQIYSCVHCDAAFDSKKEFEAHVIFSHKTDAISKKKILILGGGFGGMYVLKDLQKKLDVKNISITIVSENNFYELFKYFLSQDIRWIFQSCRFQILNLVSTLEKRWFNFGIRFLSVFLGSHMCLKYTTVYNVMLYLILKKNLRSI